MEKIVIGAIKDYNFSHIEPWLNSLQRTGYNGEVLIIDASEKVNIELKDILTTRGVNYCHMLYNSDRNFMVTRFLLLYVLLNKISSRDKIKYVLATDVRDVIFQEDPTNLMCRDGIVIESEGLKYSDEPWSRSNFNEVLGPLVYEEMKNTYIKCAGVIGGSRKLLSDLFLTIYTMCCGLQQFPRAGGGPDQAVMNIILEMDAWKSHVYHDLNIFHAGTSRYAILSGKGEIGFQYNRSSDKEKFLKEFSEKSIQTDAWISNDKIFSATTGKPFTIVHQYDRVDIWKDIDKQYRNII